MKNRFSFLDGIRGLAAIFVLTRHTSSYWGFSFYRSYLAVDLFFILSGFVISHAYDNKLSTGLMSPFTFVKVRLIRFYPVFFFSILLCVAVLFAQAKVFNQEILKTLALTAVFIPSHSLQGKPELFWLNGPYWSLFYELIINVVYAFVRRWLNNILLFTIVIFSFVMLTATAYFHHDLDAGFYFSPQSVLAGFARAIFGIFSGLLLYRHYEKLSRFVQKISSPWYAVFLICALLASPNALSLNWIFDVAIVSLIFPLCILIASRPFQSRGENLLLYLGAASYPIYLIHKPFGELVSTVFQGRQALSAPYSGLWLLCCLFPFAVLLEKKYDIPVRRKLSSFFAPINKARVSSPSKLEPAFGRSGRKFSQIHLRHEEKLYWRREIPDRRILSVRREAEHERRVHVRRCNV